jgi:hypothetical protein
VGDKVRFELRDYLWHLVEVVKPPVTLEQRVADLERQVRVLYDAIHTAVKEVA